MKFELKPYNINVTDDELIADLKKVAQELKKSSLTQREYTKSKKNRFHGGTVANRFGGWNNAIIKSGLTITKYINLSDEELINDLIHVANGRDRLTIAEYNSKGKYTTQTMGDRFGTWNNALRKAGLKITNQQNITENELYKNLEKVWIKLGRQPSRRDMKKPNSDYSEGPYIYKFKKWSFALQSFVEWSNSVSNSDEKNLNVDEKNEKNFQDSEIKTTYTSHVYLMVDNTNNFYKIGLSKIPVHREKTLQSEKPTINLILSKEYPTRQIASGIERELQKKYSNKRMRGEWFELDKNEVDWIKTFLSQK